MSKDTAQQEVEKVCFSYEKAGKTGNKKDWGKFYDLEDSLINKVEVANQTKLSIPKKIAELADKEFNQGDDVLRFGFSTTEFGFANEELRFWVTNYGEYDEVATERANILSAYLAGKALGVELVEVK